MKVNLGYAYMYARDVIKGKWFEAEPYMMKSEYLWKLYWDFITG